MRRIVLLATVAVLVLVSTPLVVSATGAHKQTTAKPTAASSQHPTRTVLIQGFRFRPAQITVKRGTRVTWINKDMTKHTATASNGAFDSGVLRPGQSYSHTFKTAGKQGYHCEIHPFMRGSVVVKR